MGRRRIDRLAVNKELRSLQREFARVQERLRRIEMLTFLKAESAANEAVQRPTRRGRRGRRVGGSRRDERGVEALPNPVLNPKFDPKEEKKVAAVQWVSHRELQLTKRKRGKRGGKKKKEEVEKAEEAKQEEKEERRVGWRKQMKIERARREKAEEEARDLKTKLTNAEQCERAREEEARELSHRCRNAEQQLKASQEGRAQQQKRPAVQLRVESQRVGAVRSSASRELQRASRPVGASVSGDSGQHTQLEKEHGRLKVECGELRRAKDAQQEKARKARKAAEQVEAKCGELQTKAAAQREEIDGLQAELIEWEEDLQTYKGLNEWQAEKIRDLQGELEKTRLEKQQEEHQVEENVRHRPPQMQPTSGSKTNAQAEWQHFIAPDGRSYWYNLRTNMSQWDTPKSSYAPPCASADGGAAA